MQPAPASRLRPARWLFAGALIVVVAAMMPTPPTAFSQDGGKPAGKPTERPRVPAQIQPGERLKVSLGSFGGDNESWFIRRVGEEGHLDLPLVGAIDARDATRIELEKHVADAFTSHGIFKNPVVAISRLDHGEDHALTGAADARQSGAVGRVDAPAEPGDEAVADRQRDTVTAVIDIRELVSMPADDGPTPILLAEKIITLIQNSVEPGAWEDNGGTIASLSSLNGQLVITATPEMLAEVRELLKKLDGSD